MRTRHRAALVAALLLAALLPAGCGTSGGRGASGGGAAPSPGSSAAGGPGRAGVQVLARGLDVPWGLAFLPDRGALVSERDTGRILALSPSGGSPREVMRLPDVDTASGEGGLLGLAVSPRYGTDRLVYAYYTSPRDNRVVRFRLGGPVEPVLSGLARARVHDGGRIAFGPDGMLYVGTGDAADGADAQDPTSRNGKILRLRPDGSVPPDNPFPGSPVYSLGHRNVQGLAWDRAGRLWATEFGRSDADEVNLILPGRNYGWPEVEGTGGTRGGRFTNPLVTWRPDEASPSGAAIRDGVLYVAALRGERLWRVPLDGTRAGRPEPLLRGRYGRLRTVAVAPDGALWVTTSNRDGRGDPSGDDDRILRLATP